MTKIQSPNKWPISKFQSSNVWKLNIGIWPIRLRSGPILSLSKDWALFGFCILVIGFFFATGYSASDENLRVHFIDVGFGDAILIESPHSQNILIDAGGQKSGGKVRGYLLRHNIKTLDAAIITHPHRNHFEGFFSLLNSITVRRLYTNGHPQEEGPYDQLLEEFRKRSVPVAVLKEKGRVSIPRRQMSIRLDILSPRDLKGSANDNSFVVWLRYRKTSFLFTSDIGGDQQSRVFTQYPQVLQSSCIQVPHHGLNVSEPLKAVSPQTIFVASMGPDPRHPAGPQDLEELAGLVFRTDIHGTIVLESDGKTLRVISEK